MKYSTWHHMGLKELLDGFKKRWWFSDGYIIFVRESPERPEIVIEAVYNYATYLYRNPDKKVGGFPVGWDQLYLVSNTYERYYYNGAFHVKPRNGLTSYYIQHVDFPDAILVTPDDKITAQQILQKILGIPEKRAFGSFKSWPDCQFYYHINIS
jgi:hypothetical protein